MFCLRDSRVSGRLVDGTTYNLCKYIEGCCVVAQSVHGVVKTVPFGSLQ